MESSFSNNEIGYINFTFHTLVVKSYFGGLLVISAPIIANEIVNDEKEF